ncbi:MULTISPECIES: hypothetical protein [Rhodococcus]|uniref:hypothetical protein n=1 Tax=Rhodococcus TaxID=1827 RepID=UPI0007CD62A6|nr:hypothetical protein [Rhodococcus gordoniae]UTT50547.1 hypothetical protein NMQ04_10505 [Rhodococcus gordoniae]
MKTTATAAPAPSRGGCTPIRPLASRAWREQRIAAELVAQFRTARDPYRPRGVRRRAAPLVVAVAEATHALRKPSLWGNPVKVFTFVVVQDGMLSRLPEWRA